MKKLIIFASLFCGIGIVYSQTKVSGTVYDNSKKPLSGVTITEKGSTNTSVSDKDGKFHISINNLKDNKYALNFYLKGYYDTQVEGLSDELFLAIELNKPNEVHSKGKKSPK